MEHVYQLLCGYVSPIYYSLSNYRKKNWLEKEVRNQLNEGKKVDETRKEVIQVKEQRKEEDQRCRKLEKSEERENEACIFYF